MNFTEQVRFLLSSIGSKYVAISTGLTDERAVHQWAGGAQPRSQLAVEKVDALVAITNVVTYDYPPTVVNAFLRSCNPHLAGATPMGLLRQAQSSEELSEARERVLRAAVDVLVG